MVKEKEYVIDTVDTNNQPLKLKVIKPTNRIAQGANKAYSAKLSQLLRENCEGKDRLLLRSEVDEFLIKSGVWTHKDKLQLEKLGVEIRVHELVLRQGGMDLEDARKLAIRMSELRTEMLEVLNKRQQFDSATVEAIAENYRFDFLVSECVFYSDSNKKYFVNYDDYIDRGDDVASIVVAEKLSEMIYGYDSNYQTKLFEHQWLREAGYTNQVGRYINREGQYVDKDGKLINEDGRYINEQGNLVDTEGRLVNNTGDFVIDDPKPFIDEDGKEIYIMQKFNATVEKMKKKKSKKNIKKTKKSTKR